MMFPRRTILFISLYCLCSLVFVSAPAQELRHFSLLPVYSKADTARVRQLINKGTELHWTDPDTAMRLLEEAERLSVARGYTAGAARALVAMAHTAIGRGQYDESFAFYDKARQYCLLSADKSLLPRLYSDIGTTYLLQSDYLRASWYYFEALRGLMRNNMGEDPSVLVLYANLAYLQTKAERYEQALYYLDKAELIARRRHYYGQLGFILDNKGGVYRALKQPDKAMALLGEGLEMVLRDSVQAPVRNLEIRQAVLTSMAELLLEGQRPDSAIACLKEALSLSAGTNPYFSFIFPQYLLGKAYYQLHEYARAESAIVPALAQARRLQFREDMPDALQTLAGVYEATGRYREALESHKEYVQLKDSITDKEKVQALSQLEVRYRTAQKDKQLAENELQIARQGSELARKNIWILVASLGALLLTLLSLLLWVLYRNNQHRQRLQAERIRVIEHEKERIVREKSILEREEEIRVMQALIDGEERERGRLARELHDGIGGMIAAVRMHCSVLQGRIGGEELSGSMSTVLELLDRTAAEIRETAHNLMPDVVLRHSFEEALQLYCNQVNVAGLLSLSLQLHGAIPEMNKQAALSLYRIVQELVQNIVRHSGAAEAVVQVCRQDDMLSVLIEDNGSGFAPDGPKNGMGLQNLQSRVKALQGFISIESVPGTGTTVYLEFHTRYLKTDQTHEHYDRYSG